MLTQNSLHHEKILFSTYFLWLASFIKRKEGWIVTFKNDHSLLIWENSNKANICYSSTLRKMFRIPSPVSIKVDCKKTLGCPRKHHNRFTAGCLCVHRASRQTHFERSAAFRRSPAIFHLFSQLRVAQPIPLSDPVVETRDVGHHHILWFGFIPTQRSFC